MCRNINYWGGGGGGNQTSMKCYFTLIKMAKIKRYVTAKAGKNIEKSEYSYTMES